MAALCVSLHVYMIYASTHTRTIFNIHTHTYTHTNNKHRSPSTPSNSWVRRSCVRRSVRLCACRHASNPPTHPHVHARSLLHPAHFSHTLGRVRLPPQPLAVGGPPLRLPRGNLHKYMHTYSECMCIFANPCTARWCTRPLAYMAGLSLPSVFLPLNIPSVRSFDHISPPSIP